MSMDAIHLYQGHKNPGIELKVAQAGFYSDVIRVLQKYFFEEMNATHFRQPNFSYQRSGTTVHSEFLIRSSDNAFIGRIDYKDAKLMVPSMAIILRNGRTIVIVYKTESVSRYSKRRDWRNQKNVARFFEDTTGVLEEEVNISYAMYLEEQKKESIPSHRRQDEERGIVMEAKLPLQNIIAAQKRRFSRQKRP